MASPIVLTIDGLLALLSFFKIDPAKFRKPATVLLDEYNARDTVFFVLNGRLGKKRCSAKIFIICRGQQLRECKRVFPNGEEVEEVKPWAISGTFQMPEEPVRDNASGEKPVEAAVRELKDEIRLIVAPEDLIPRNGGLPIEPGLRGSSAWVGLLALEIQYHFLYEMEEMRWHNGLVVYESDGTEVHLAWGPQTVDHPEGAYSKAQTIY